MKTSSQTKLETNLGLDSSIWAKSDNTLRLLFLKLRFPKENVKWIKVQPCHPLAATFHILVAPFTD